MSKTPNSDKNITLIPVKRRKGQNSEHYVDKEVFFKAIEAYNKDYTQAVKNKSELPQIPNYIGQCFDKIAKKLSFHPWFIGYSEDYKKEMIGDGLETCVKYCHKFNPKISKNPFAYFTQVVYFCFRQRILKERKQQYIKYKSFQHSRLEESLAEEDLKHFSDDVVGQILNRGSTYDNLNDFITVYEKGVEEKKKKKVAKAKSKFTKFVKKPISKKS